MAEVWRARSRGVAGFEKTVVIKRVLPSLLERQGFAELLVREAKIAARLSHPNVIQIYDLGEQDGSYYIAMEYLRGRDIAAALSFRGPGESPMSLELRLWIAAEVAKALDYAHRARGDDGKPLNIVHRDVSPQNVLLGYEGEVKVADFGIARADEPGLGRGEDPKVLRGKYAYMSPEQARGEPLDRRSDIFSFGILLYELCTRRRMFGAMSSTDTLKLVRGAELPDFRARLPRPELVPILERALAADRDARYESAVEIHDALLKLLFAIGKPVSQTDLATAMHEMFPRDETFDPNKLRVDLLARAHVDASAASQPGREMTRSTVEAPVTQALPTSRRLRTEGRRLIYLVTPERSREGELFDEVVERAGGAVLQPRDGLRLAAFGLAGMERAVGHAVRSALELRRASRVRGLARVETTPPLVVLGGEARVLEGVVVEPAGDVVTRALALVEATESGDLSVEAALGPELGRDFRFETRGDVVRVEGFRSRRDQDAGELRRRAPLVGRRDVLRELSAALIDAAAGKGKLVHLVGPPGVGKSRLLAELRSAAAPQDFVFVHGRADEADAEQSFGALGDLVMDLCGVEAEDTPAQRFEKVERLRVLGLRPRAVRLVGELIGLAYPVATPLRLGRPRGIELALGIRTAIRNLSRERVVVLALEDLQWMDDATRQILPLLVEGLVPGRVLVLVTRRSGSAGPLPAGGRSIEVEPLDRDATGRLLAYHVGARAVEPELADHVRAESGGIPAWIDLVASPLAPTLLVEEGVARRGPETQGRVAVPASVQAVVEARIERLRQRERSMLRVVAALGGSVEVSLLAAVEGLVGHTERPHLRRLWVRGLLVSDDESSAEAERLGAWGGDEEDERLPAVVRLPSELLRRAVLAELEGSDVPRLHSRIVATLERLEAGATLDGLERLAHHAERSLDSRRAPDYWQRAAERALADGERRRAAEHFAKAAQLLREVDGDAADPCAFDLSLRSAAAALDEGLAALADAALAPLTAVVERLDPPRRVRHALALGRLAGQRLETDRALLALASVEDLLDRVDDELRIRALFALARGALERGETARALEVLERILDGADGVDRGAARALQGVALARADRLEDAEVAVNDALAIAARVGDRRLRFAALAALAVLVEGRGDLDLAAARYREAAEVGAEIATPDDLARLHARGATCALAAGDIAEATRQAHDAGRHADRSPAASWGHVVAALRGALAIREHPDASYFPGVVRAVERLEALERPGEAALAVEMLAHAHLALHDAAAAVRTLERAIGLAERVGDRGHARRLAAARDALG